MQGAIIAFVVNGEVHITGGFRALSSRWESPWGPVVVVEHLSADGLRSYLHYFTFLPHQRHVSIRSDQLYGSTLSENLGQVERLEVPISRYLSEELPVPDGTLPPVPPHRGAGQFNCGRPHLGLIEEDDTKKRIRQEGKNKHGSAAHSGHDLTAVSRPQRPAGTCFTS